MKFFVFILLALLPASCVVSNPVSSNGASSFSSSSSGYNGQVSNTNVTNTGANTSAIPLPVPATPLASSNFTGYQVSLAPYEFKVFIISNYTEALADTSPGWWKDAVVYQVFVRSFKDSGSDGKGDLQGLASKMDYITNIGFNAIWTLPIFSSPSVHGYDATDYYSINPDYGSQSDFNNYVNTAHTKGVRVVLDMVINHTSSSHQWFVDSKNSANGKRDWYVWTNASLTELSASNWQTPWGGGSASSCWQGSSPYYYGAFGGGMPDLNLVNPTVISEVKNIAGYWLADGVDGYRLDAVRYYVEDGPYPLQADSPGTYNFVTNYEAYIKSVNPSAFTVGEVASSYSGEGGYYLSGSGLDMDFSFDFPGDITGAINGGNASSFNSLISSKPGGAPWNFFAPFLDNHDSFYQGARTMDTLGTNFNKAKLAAALLLTFAGTPFVYYGTEIGMQSQGTGDDSKRRPMQWDTSAYAGFSTVSPAYNSLATYTSPYNVSYQLADPNSLLNLYRMLIAFRRLNTALTRGTIKTVTSSLSTVAAYIRPGTNYTVLIVANLGSATNTTSLNFNGSGLSSGGSYGLSLLPFLPQNTNGVITGITTNFYQTNSDPASDELLNYPTNGGFVNGVADMTNVTVKSSVFSLDFSISMRATQHTWGWANGFDHVILTVFLQRSNSTSAITQFKPWNDSHADLLYSAQTGWDYAVTICGKSVGIFTNQSLAGTGSVTASGTTLNVSMDPSLLGNAGGNFDHWKYVIFSQDYDDGAGANDPTNPQGHGYRAVTNAADMGVNSGYVWTVPSGNFTTQTMIADMLGAGGANACTNRNVPMPNGEWITLIKQ